MFDAYEAPDAAPSPWPSRSAPRAAVRGAALVAVLSAGLAAGPAAGQVQAGAQGDLPAGASAGATLGGSVAATADIDADVPAPEEVIGFEPGEAHRMADNEQLLAYYEAIAEASDRVELREIGETTRGRPMHLMFISSSGNLEELDRWREISTTLGTARGVSEEEARELSEEGKAVVWIDAGLHSTERATTQHVPHLAHHLITDDSRETRRIRENVVLLLMPVMNPDGHEVVVDWFREQQGTLFERTSPPELYSEYTGHDNNRDWFMLTQRESQVVARVLYEEWMPQIIFNHHQTGPFPARITIPPFAEPVNPNIHPLVVRGANLIGSHMGDRFDALDMPGVLSHTNYDMWWNGGMRLAPYFHNQLGILAEVQHNHPGPRTVEPEEMPDEIVSRGRVVSTREPSIFYPNPWPGGTMTYRESVDYHFEASMATLDIASLRPEAYLYNFYKMGRDHIESGQEGDPFAYVVPPDQWDAYEAVEMLNVLRRGGVEVHEATADFEAGGETYPAGSRIVFAGQAFQAHVRDLMEPQEYPERRLYPDGPPEPPYDLAGWTLPIQMGVDVARIDEPFEAEVREVEDRVAVWEGRVDGGVRAEFGYALEPRSNAAAIAVNRLLAAGEAVSRSGAGSGLEPGSFLVARDGADTDRRVEELAAELGVVFRALDGEPDGELHALRQPRVGVYRSWVANIPEGWIRWILDTYEFPMENVWDEDLREGDLSHYDILVLPAQDPGNLLDGHEPGSMPERYVGGMGAEGAAALQEFARGGGTVLALDGAVDVVVEQFGLPVESAVEGVPEEDFFIPGSLLRIRAEPAHPLAFGMQEEAVGTFVTRRGSQSRAFRVLPGEGEEAVEPFVEWGPEGDELLLSGWALGEGEYLAGEPSALHVREGDGHVVLLGFRAGFRGQPRNSFKVLFNAFYAAAAEGLLEGP